MKFLEQPYQQRLVLSGGTVKEPKTKTAPAITLHLAGERGRIAGTGTLAVSRQPVRDFVVTGAVHHISNQTIITLRAYEWDTLVGSIIISLDGKGGAANYKLKLDEVWKVEGAKVKAENLASLL